MKIIFVSLLLLILTSAIITITVQESYSTSKADEIREGAEDLEENIEEKIKGLGTLNDNLNDNQNIQNELDNSEDTEDTSSKNNNNNNDQPSIADELRELAKLKEEGIITEEEFTEMKEDLIE